MGLIKVIEQGANPETAGVPMLIVAGKLKVASGVVTIGSESLTYTSTASTKPSDESLFNSWAPVVDAIYGASGPSILGPVILDAAGDKIYPAIA